MQDSSQLNLGYISRMRLTITYAYALASSRLPYGHGRHDENRISTNGFGYQKRITGEDALEGELDFLPAVSTRQAI